MPPTKRNLSNLESLLLAQAVWELGATSNNWTHIAKLLSKHPLLTRPKSFFTAQSCHSMYETLMKEANLEIDESVEEANAPTNLTLARKHYQARFSQLKELILAEETKFKTVLKEIEDIRSGNWGKQPKATQSDLINALPPGNPEGAHVVQPSVSDDLPVSESIDTQKDVDIETKPAEVPEEAETGAVDVSSNDNNESNIPIEVIETTSHRSSSRLPSVEGDKVVPDTSTLSELHTESHPDTQTSSSDRREEEEEEEETVMDDAGKEEEEETSQGQLEEVDMDQDNVNEAQASQPSAPTPEPIDEPKEQASPQSPVSPEKEIHAEEEEKVNESSAEEEPVVATRRSTRHRKSSAASAVLPLHRTRQRRGRPSDNEPQPTADSEAENEAKDGSASQAEDDAEPVSTRRKEGKRKASTNELLDSPDKKRMREDSEALDDEDQGSTSHNTRGRVTRGAIRTEEQVALKRFQSVIAMLHQQISQHRNGNIFHNPIKNSEAPDYHDIVKRPMDLKTIKTRVKDGIIANSLEYQRDIYLMFANAMMYNRPGSDVHAMAEDMMIESEAQIHTFRQTEGLAKRQRS
ncbi:hypothetical protein CVT24_004053 [Panaeolus cyanescens]|uniref:Bromo domain-containing protein n=1 Tax=Panaeolus cyanescens TaxID=181874 RepID=A0A409Y6A1_9AGAR|nr:hypothetical protein CVT24_004053 [Panaeolus cyanescens]